MLSELYKGGSSEFVTKDELMDVIDKLFDEIMTLKGIRGEDGRDAIVTQEHISKISELVRPIKGIDYKDGERGERGPEGPRGKDGDNADLTGPEIISRIKDCEEQIPVNIDFDRKVADRFKEIESWTQRSVVELLECKEMCEENKAICIEIQNNGAGDCECPDEICLTGEATPTEPAPPGSIAYNSDLNCLWIFTCGQWVQIATVGECCHISPTQDLNVGLAPTQGLGQYIIQPTQGCVDVEPPVETFYILQEDNCKILIENSAVDALEIEHI